MTTVTIPDFSAVSLVSFDLWMTLIKSDPDYKPARAELIRTLMGLPTEMSEQVAKVTRAVDRQLDEVMVTSGTQIGPAERVGAIAFELGVDLGSDWCAEIAEAVQKLTLSYVPVHIEPNLLESLATIRATGRQIAFVSNTGFIDGTYMRAVMAANGLGPMADIALYSDEVGVSKPDPRIFAQLASLSGRAGGQILHYGDNATADYAGAQAAGFAAALRTDSPRDGYFVVSTVADLAARFN